MIRLGYNGIIFEPQVSRDNDGTFWLSLTIARGHTNHKWTSRPACLADAGTWDEAEEQAVKQLRELQKVLMGGF
jgi:hypothetical protein